jgi:hypothetical protein
MCVEHTLVFQPTHLADGEHWNRQTTTTTTTTMTPQHVYCFFALLVLCLIKCPDASLPCIGGDDEQRSIRGLRYRI